MGHHILQLVYSPRSYVSIVPVSNLVKSKVFQLLKYSTNNVSSEDDSIISE